MHGVPDGVLISGKRDFPSPIFFWLLTLRLFSRSATHDVAEKH